MAIPIAVFGADHLTQAHDIMKMVPSWMPGKLFWAYFVGVALLAAALSFTFRVWVRGSATLLGIMMFCFVAMMDIPAALAAPQNRFAWILLAREWAFGAGGFLLAITSLQRRRTTGENRVALLALYSLALISIFYGVEHFLHPDRVPAVPIEKALPLWIPFPHFWTLLTGAALVIGGAAMLAPNFSRPAAAALGAWVVLLVLTLYLAMMIAQPDVEGINYFTDTLMFGGVLLVASRGYEVSP